MNSNNLDNFLAEKGTANLLIAGATGSGKSTLVNLVFNKQLAETGMGKPVTKSTTVYEDAELPIKLFDTKGFELGSEEHKKSLEEIQVFMNDANVAADEQVHLVWYVIAASNNRILKLDIELIKKFQKINKPVCVVLTKTDTVSYKNLQILIQLLKENDIKGFYVSARMPERNYLQLHELIEWSYEQLDDFIDMAFLRSQTAHLDLLKKEVNKAIRAYAVSSFGIGFTPIPFADGPILLANQGLMIHRILNKYGLDNIKDQMKGIIGTLGAGQLVSQLGRYLVAQVLKFIPGVGPLASGMINGTVAVAITVSLGLTVSEISYRIAKAIMDDDSLDIEKFIETYITPDIVNSLFEQFFNKEIKNKG